MNAEFIDINLLPRPIRHPLGGPAWRRLMISGLALLFLALLLIIGGWRLKSRNEDMLEQQRAELAQLQGEIQALSGVMAEVDLLQHQVTTLAVQAEQLEGDAERVNRTNPPMSPFLRALTETLLPRMKITGLLEIDSGRFLVQGEAGSNSLVVEYANGLKQRPEIRAVNPRSVEQLGEEAPPGAVRWTLEVQR